MESLVSKLENEVGLTHEQAMQAVGCFRNYMVENELQPDWEAFIKAKAQDLSAKAKQALGELSGKKHTFGEKMDDWVDKTQDKLDDLTDKAKQTINEARSKAADFIAPKD